MKSYPWCGTCDKSVLAIDGRVVECAHEVEWDHSHVCLTCPKKRAHWRCGRRACHGFLSRTCQTHAIGARATAGDEAAPRELRRLKLEVQARAMQSTLFEEVA